jgi:hypothetical protein
MSKKPVAMKFYRAKNNAFSLPEGASMAAFCVLHLSREAAKQTATPARHWM